jgi:arylsulfatase A-like enzyme
MKPNQIFCALCIFISLLGCEQKTSNEDFSRPNLLFVFADQFRKQAVGFMKEDPVITPNFDRFASEGVAFTNAVSSCPICSPYRAMIMTGKFPLTTGMTSNCMPGTDLEMKTTEVTVGDILKEFGYATGYIGKWHLEIPSLNRSAQPIDSATDAWDGWTPPGPRRHGFDFWYAYNSNGKHYDPNYWKDLPDRIDIDEWSVKHETDIAISFIDKVPDGQPFALFMSWNPPHNPYVAPEKYMNMYKDSDLKMRPNVKRSDLFENRFLPYLAAVSSCDDHFGRLMEYLESNGLAENTIVVFTSDHGEMMGSQGRFAKSVWYDESIGIPFMIRWPGRIKPAKENMPFACYNFMPTLLGLMQLPIPEDVEGTDYSSFLLGRSEATADAAVIASYGNPARLLSIGQEPSIWALQADTLHQLGVDWRKVGYRGLRTERYTYVVNRGRKGEDLTRYLYDNEMDPYQMDPIISEEIKGEIMEGLNEELAGWLTKMKDPFSVN